jgi:hypothetical protein
MATNRVSFHPMITTITAAATSKGARPSHRERVERETAVMTQFILESGRWRIGFGGHL